MSFTNNLLLVFNLSIILFCLIPHSVTSQSFLSNSILNCNIEKKIPEPILNQLNDLKKNRDKLDYLLKQVIEIRHSDPELAFLLAKEGANIGDLNQYPRPKAELLWWQSTICSSLNHESALHFPSLEWANMSAEIFKNVNDKMGLAKAYSQIAQIYYDRDSFTNAFTYINYAEEIIEEVADNIILKWQILGDLSRLKGNISYLRSGPNFEIINKYDSSQNYYERAGNYFGLGILNESRALVYANFAFPDSTEIIQLYQNALNYFEKVGNQIAWNKTQYLLAVFYSDLFFKSLFKGTQEEQSFETSNKILRNILDKPSSDKCKVYYLMAANYQNRSIYLFDSLQIYAPQLLDTALLYYRQGLHIAIDEVNYQGLNLLTKGASTICPYLQEKKCTELFQLVDTAHLEILNNYAQLRESAEQERNNFQTALRKFEKRQIKTTYFLFLILLSIAFGAIYLVQRWRNVKAALDMRMKALRARMNPHFISNCLNAIDSLVNQNRNDEASKYLIDFDRLCRQILDNSNEELIPLREELDTLANFISLEKLRLDDNLTYFLKVDEHVNQEEVHIPSMLLQPFVENAIWHGIQKKQAPGILKVEIKQKEGKYLECMVEDDGIGREKAKQMEENSVLNRQSWGLSITEERIKALKNISGSELDIIDLYDDKGEARGTRVHILLPILKNKVLHDEGNHS